MTALLSIHSSVTAGFVGNSVAGPVLLSLHVQPLLVDTVLLAAHPGYGRRAGGAVPDDLFGEVLDGIVDLTDLHHIKTVVSGYLGGVGQVEAIAALIDSWRRAATGPYVLDPVLGDAGRLYMPEKLAAAIRDKLLPRPVLREAGRRRTRRRTGRGCTAPSSSSPSAASSPRASCCAPRCARATRIAAAPDASRSSARAAE